MLGKVLGGVGVLALLHVTYSAVHYRDYMKAMGHAVEASSMPWDVVGELLLAFVCIVAGALIAHGPFLSIHSSDDSLASTMDAFLGRPDFVTFNHRGRALRTRRAAAAAT